MIKIKIKGEDESINLRSRLVSKITLLLYKEGVKYYEVETPIPDKSKRRKNEVKNGRTILER